MGYSFLVQSQVFGEKTCCYGAGLTFPAHRLQPALTCLSEQTLCLFSLLGQTHTAASFVDTAHILDVIPSH